MGGLVFRGRPAGSTSLTAPRPVPATACPTPRNHGTTRICAAFGRMDSWKPGVVTLSGTHNLDGCHAADADVEREWVSSLTGFANQYFCLLLFESWEEKTTAATGDCQPDHQQGHERRARDPVGRRGAGGGPPAV
ncbi:hypothetical protein MAPG_04572 [Magnaporthiopsis poae ATCC 64411]|uniref:Uncharacterized protein n=1 Tax=Magnaporthiopsis poae (strain ATCC 64411 / 73-15) TaxID=644358 RepID=A0A0C4DX34_MAGP6|nr:hypothetical protein MAPG_04572 [Magnaporthiopsis poae ATCC 64411]